MLTIPCPYPPYENDEDQNLCDHGAPVQGYAFAISSTIVAKVPFQFHVPISADATEEDSAEQAFWRDHSLRSFELLRKEGRFPVATGAEILKDVITNGWTGCNSARSFEEIEREVLDAIGAAESTLKVHNSASWDWMGGLAAWFGKSEVITADDTKSLEADCLHWLESNTIRPDWLEEDDYRARWEAIGLHVEPGIHEYHMGG
ncbi:uncharacterized protein KY384_001272 [Bacidia gigantensis]|uniref:uncharacterized protein n=1 Tax=Bacidia gigantensis TaxID=2732470 RepID=UPI001D05AADE|nr:uncharacterized protein KY384_001272 [Bacidia gigantensis]KAG8533532.1 hypothetical protein KY384_001272 [Bacidia gigantensis]